jgi:hypothetical protein
MSKEDEARLIAEELEKSLVERKEQFNNLQEMLDKAEPLPDLNVPIRDVLGLIATLQPELTGQEFQLFLFMLAMMYGIDHEEEFMKRLAKTALVTPPKNIEVTAKP